MRSSELDNEVSGAAEVAAEVHSDELAAEDAIKKIGMRRTVQKPRSAKSH